MMENNATILHGVQFKRVQVLFFVIELSNLLEKHFKSLHVRSRCNQTRAFKAGLCLTCLCSTTSHRLLDFVLAVPPSPVNNLVIFLRDVRFRAALSKKVAVRNQWDGSRLAVLPGER